MISETKIYIISEGYFLPYIFFKKNFDILINYYLFYIGKHVKQGKY